MEIYYQVLLWVVSDELIILDILKVLIKHLVHKALDQAGRNMVAKSIGAWADHLGTDDALSDF